MGTACYCSTMMSSARCASASMRSRRCSNVWRGCRVIMAEEKTVVTVYRPSRETEKRLLRGTYRHRPSGSTGARSTLTFEGGHDDVRYIHAGTRWAHGYCAGAARPAVGDNSSPCAARTWLRRRDSTSVNACRRTAGRWLYALRAGVSCGGWQRDLRAGTAALRGARANIPRGLLRGSASAREKRPTSLARVSCYTPASPTCSGNSRVCAGLVRWDERGQ